MLAMKIIVFQFLIGRLKNGRGRDKPPGKGGVSIPYRQTKKRRCRHRCRRRTSLFQFLIGRLKNILYHFYPAQKNFVSIPYRQTKKREQNITHIDLFIPVSIPYRQTKKLCVDISDERGNIVFQFLIGRLKNSCFLYSLHNYYYGFNSLQVD